MIKSTDMSCNFPVALANALAYRASQFMRDTGIYNTKI